MRHPSVVKRLGDFHVICIDWSHRPPCFGKSITDFVAEFSRLFGRSFPPTRNFRLKQLSNYNVTVARTFRMNNSCRRKFLERSLDLCKTIEIRCQQFALNSDVGFVASLVTPPCSKTTSSYQVDIVENDTPSPKPMMKNTKAERIASGRKL